MDTHKLLLPHLRQYRHNDNSGFVAAYDRPGIEQVFKTLQQMAYEDGWNDAIAQFANLLDKMDQKHD